MKKIINSKRSNYFNGKKKQGLILVAFLPLLVILNSCRLRADQISSAAADKSLTRFHCSDNLVGEKPVNWELSLRDKTLTVQKSPKQKVEGYFSLEENWKNKTYHLHAMDIFSLRIMENKIELDVTYQWRIPEVLTTPKLMMEQPPTKYGRYLCKKI